MDELLDDNLLCDEAVRDPHAYFGRLRESSPVHWSVRHRSWVITRYADVVSLLRSPLLTAERITPFAGAITKASGSDQVAATFAILEDWLVFKDPPDHTRLRRLLQRAFSTGVVRTWEPRIRAIIDGLLDDLEGREHFDLIRDFAYPLPAIVIAEMLGAPPQDRDLFKEWSDQITALVFGAYDSEDRYERAAAGMSELRAYLVGLIERFEADPGDNLISLLLEREGDDSLSRDELVASCTLLLFGGHETTTNLIGNGALALLTHRDQWEALQADRSLVPSAVEEILRFDGPARATVRLVKERHELDGHEFEEGQRVFLVNLAANRDPAAFAEPERFDVKRSPNSHLGFGFGIHYCLGAPLARVEGQLALSGLIDRYPSLELADPSSLTWHPTMLSRGLHHLPVAT
jgi:cytochrome P450